MEWYIGGPFYTEDGENYMENGLKCIDYIDYWPDVIDEDAVSEKYFKKVLRKLIQKADNEIEELEGNLFMLQSRLEWAEQNRYDEWFDICYNGLKEHIKKLELAICILKDVHHEDLNDGHLKLLGQPVRRVDEVIKDLLTQALQNRHEQMAQPAESISEGVSTDQQTADIFFEDLGLSEQPAGILCRDSSGPSDSVTAEIEKAKSKPNSEHMDENVIQPLEFHGHELVNSVTEKALSLIPSLELQQLQEKNKAKSEPSGISSDLVLSDACASSKGIHVKTSQSMKSKDQSLGDSSSKSRRSARQTVSDDGSLKSYLTSRKKHKRQNSGRWRDSENAYGCFY